MSAIDPALHTVLVVDDDPSPRTSFQLALRKYYNVFAAANGTEALELIKLHQPDVLLLDLRMPGMSGLEVLAAAREIDPLVSAIILTAYESLDTAKEAVRLRATRYMTKPPNLEELRRAVAEAVRVREFSVHASNVAQVLDRASTFDTDLVAAAQRSTAEVYAGVLHDMSNPFSVALGYLDVAMMDLEKLPRPSDPRGSITIPAQQGADIHLYTERARDALVQAYDLAQRYLRTTRTLQVASDEPMPLGAFIDEVLTIVSAHRAARERNLRFSAIEEHEDCDFDLSVPVRVDAVLLTQILNNLLVNALQASPVGAEVVLRAEVRKSNPPQPPIAPERLIVAEGVKPQDYWMTFTISDRGRGMNPDTLSRAVIPFFTTKGESGTGMGLSMVARLTKQLGGWLALESQVDHGTDATVCVPFTAAPTPAVAPALRS